MDHGRANAAVVVAEPELIDVTVHDACLSISYHEYGSHRCNSAEPGQTSTAINLC